MKILKFMDKYLEEFFMLILLTIMVVSISAQVIMRKVFDSSLSWSEELARYCFIWLVYIGVGYAVKVKKHLKTDVLYDKLNEKSKKVVRIFANLFFIAFALYICIKGFGLALKFFKLGQVSPALHIPMGLIYLAAPVGLGLAVIRLIQSLISEVKNTPSVEQEG